jgi:hypothetical protein
MTYESLGKLQILEATKIPIWVPENIDILEADYTPNDSPIHSLGFCQREYNPPGRFSFTMMVKPGLSPTAHVFTRGHEEGHLMTNLGELSILQEHMADLGYSFPFLTKYYVNNHDLAAKRVIAGTNSAADYTTAWTKPTPINEAIANVGGLVALIKRGVNQNMVNSVYQEILDGQISPFVI